MARYRIMMPCPKCAQDKSNLRSQSWTHGGRCGGDLYIDENAYVHCQKCGKSAHISKMTMTCDSQRHIKTRATKNELGAAFAIGNVGVSNNASSLKWFKKLLDNI